MQLPSLAPAAPTLFEALLPAQTAGAPAPVLTLVGMSGSGKSTVGRLLARTLECGHLDTDSLIEAFYGMELEPLYQALGRDAFLEAEAGIVGGLWLARAVVSTGGSVIYSANAMRHLQSRGPVIWLRTSPATVTARLQACGTRGLAIAPGQTLDALVLEREPLYAAAADHHVETDGLAPEAVADHIIHWLKERSRS
ncbi:shikimate kinase [Megalodesulfovibrio gigas]|uniref:Shikimate kinase n=1 Tax=Megalodesulfovibrio gigas (strain ATCC 19364 / DSM 1382 / NCIMB 9332 / VKM B-1759) TaxID=1121448 RepID=T2GFL6_MEGG1|nr:shikimate kinase [Megalodesulfovibrio gigas]AGW14984.1 putative shikimate kinase [Megalodesulfovibrio gigas DSM 1382 = ATCC 19364]